MNPGGDQIFASFDHAGSMAPRPPSEAFIAPLSLGGTRPALVVSVEVVGEVDAMRCVRPPTSIWKIVLSVPRGSTPFVEWKDVDVNAGPCPASTRSRFATNTPMSARTSRTMQHSMYSEGMKRL